MSGRRHRRTGRHVDDRCQAVRRRQDRARDFDDYESKYGIEKFDLTIDWGWFWFFTKPLFWLLEWLYVHLGNFGLSILVLTVIVKAVFFPLANKSYAAMSKMKRSSPRWRSSRSASARTASA